MTKPYWLDADEISEEVRKDSHLSKIIEGLEKDCDSQRHYTLQYGRLFYKRRLVLVSNSAWIPRLLQKFHSTPMGGHSGVYRTYRRLAAGLYWKGIKAQEMKFLAE